jgi:hypothetical protein
MPIEAPKTVSLEPIISATQAMSDQLKTRDQEVANLREQLRASEERERTALVRSEVQAALSNSGKSLWEGAADQIELLLSSELVVNFEDDGKLTCRGKDFSEAKDFLRRKLLEERYSHFFKSGPTGAPTPAASPDVPYRGVPESQLSLGQRVIMQHAATQAERLATRPQLPASLDPSQKFGIISRR